MNHKPVVRIAPSPTGWLHIGTVRTALFNYLYAKNSGGKFIFRIEDTDKLRSKKEYEDDILGGFEWLNIEFDEFYRQSERGNEYKKLLEQLLRENRAYISKEEKDGVMSPVIRFRNPKRVVSFNDTLRGDIKMDTSDLGDFVIAKNLDEPLYHFAVVSDDYLMGVTNIIRGDDGLSNTPRQILIQEALGAPRPIYTHLPLILAPDRSKLSKRHGAVSISEYKATGYLKEAIINYLALLGWNPKNDREMFSLEELAQSFNLDQLNKSGAIFNIEKLNWFNKEYIKLIPKNQLISQIKEVFPNIAEGILSRASDTIIERITVLQDIKKIKDTELSFLSGVNYEKEMLLWKKEPSLEKTKERLIKLKDMIENTDEFQSVESAKKVIWEYAEKEGRGEVLWPLRIALSGLEKSPDPFTLLYILQKSESLSRIDLAIQKLND